MADPSTIQTPEPKKTTSAGKVVFWCFIAALLLLLVFEYFDISNHCLQHHMMKDWQSTFC